MILIIITDEMSNVDNTPIYAYTDGACKNNPGRGGWGWVYMVPVSYHTVDSTIYYSECGGERITTNNKMELTAVIELLRSLDLGSHVVIHIDSKYVINSLVKGDGGILTSPRAYSGWMKSWIASGWSRPAKNRNYFQALDEELTKHLSNGSCIEIKWVKGHSNDPGNDMADALANEGVPGVSF